MPEEFESIGEAYQKVSKEGFDAAVRSLSGQQGFPGPCC